MFEAYKIGIRISLINHAASGLLGLSRQFMQAEQGARKLEMRLLSIKQKALKGGLMSGIGAAGLSLFKGPLEEARKYETELARFKLFGLGDNAQREADRFAKSTQVIGASTRDMLRYFNEAQGVFRESGLSILDEQLAGAKLAAPVLAKIQFATQALDEHLKQKTRASSMDMLRLIEMSGGLNSPERFNQLANAGFKAMMSSGGTVDWSQYRQFMARAGVAAQNMDTVALFAKMEPVISELKGATAGFALRTAYNRLNAIIRIPNQVAHELVRSGIWDASKVVFNARGGIKRFKGQDGPLIDAALFSTDPISFYERKIKPMYARMGLSSPAQIARQNAMLFGSTGGAMFSLIDRQLPVIHKSVKAYQKAHGIDAAVIDAKGTLGGQKQDLHANWEKFLNEVGTAVLPLATLGIKGLNAALQGLTDWARKNTGVARGLSLAFAVFSGALAFRGTVLLLAAAFDVLRLSMWGGLGGVAGKGASVLAKAAKSKPARFVAKHLIKAPLTSIANKIGLSKLFRAITRKINLLRLSGAIVGKSGLFSSAIAAMGAQKHVVLLGKKMGQGFSKAGAGLRAAAAAVPWLKPFLAWIGRWVMIGLRAIPIIGWVVMAVTLGVWLLRNWNVIWKKVKEIGVWAGKMIVGAWVWVKEKIGPIWTALKNALGRALKTFVWRVLDQWQFLFNAIISCINKILPKARELNRLTFADRYRKRHLPDKESRYIATSHYAIQITPAPIIWNNRKIAEVVFRGAGKNAAIVTSATGTRYDLSLGAPPPALNAAW